MLCLEKGEQTDKFIQTFRKKILYSITSNPGIPLVFLFTSIHFIEAVEFIVQWSFRNGTFLHML
jgi:hypothetical protein